MWPSIIRMVLTGLMLLPFHSATAAAQSSSDRSWKSGQPVRIVYCKNCYPFQYTDDGGRPAGLLIDLWRLWSKKTGLEVRFIGVPWPQTLTMMKRGRTDIHAGLFYSQARARFLDYAVPLSRVNVNFFYHRSLKGLRRLADLKPYRLGIIKGDHAQAYVRRHLPGARIVLYPGYKALIAAAAAGRIRVIIADGPPTLHYLKKQGLGKTFLVDPDRPIYGRELYSAARRGDTSLLRRIIRGMARVTTEERSAVEQRWLPLTLTPSVAPGQPVSALRLTPAEKRWLKAHPVIRVGVDPAWPPFDFLDPQGKHRGMAADYLALLSRRLGVKFKVVLGKGGRPLTWNQVLEQARQRKLDVVACLTETPDRRKYLTFTRPYIEFPWVVVTRRDHPTVAGVQAFYGQRVTVVKGYAIAETLGRSHPGLKLVRVDSPLRGLEAVATGRVEAYAGSLAVVAYLIQKHNLSNLKVAAPTGGRGDRLRIGVRPDRPVLVAILDKGLASISPAERAKIHRRWFRVQFEHGVHWRMVWRIALLVGLVAVIILIVTFIWNRRLAREVARRRQAEGQLQSIAANVPGAIFQFQVKTDGRRGFTYVSDRSLDFFGLTPRQMLTNADEFHVLAEDRPRFFETMDEAVRSGGDWQFVGRMTTPRGEAKWFRVSAKNTRTEEGDTVFNGILLDVTERKKAEIEYLATEKKIRAMSQAVTDALVMLDSRGRVVFWNKAAERLFGLPAEEAMGLDFHAAAVPDEFRAKALQGIDRFGRTGEGEVIGATIETTGLRRNGETFPAEVSVASFQVDDDWFAVGSVRDITARKRAEQELKVSREEFRAVVEGSPVAMVAMDEDGHLDILNDRVTEMLGYGPEDIPTMDRWWMLAYPDQEYRRMVQQNFVSSVSKDMDSGRQTPFREWKVTAKDGTVLDVQFHSRTIGERILFILVDVTERKGAEEEIKKREAHLRALVDSSGDSIIVMDNDRTIIDCNPAFTEQFGYAKEEITGRSVAVLHQDQESFEQFGRMIYSVIQETGTWRGEWVLKRRDGSTFPVESVTSAERLPDGSIIGFVAVVRDITEQKRAAEALRKSEEHLRALVQSSVDAILTLDTERHVTDCNQAYMDLFGYTREEIVGHSVANIHPDEERFLDFGKAVYPVVRETGGWRGEWTYRTKDGRLIPMENAISAIRRPDGSIEGFVAILRDITERKAMENLAQIERERMQGILDGSPIGVAISTHFDGIVRFANPRFVALFNLRVGDRVEESFVDLADRDHIVAELKRTGIITDYALQAHGSDGKRLDILTSCFRAEYDGQPAILGWYVDITELKRTEKDLTARLDQLDRFRRMAVGREHKMIDLKREINQLLNASGQQDKYRIVTEETPDTDVQGHA